MVSKTILCTHSSGTVWKSRWPSWAVRPNEPSGFRGRNATLNHAALPFKQFQCSSDWRWPSETRKFRKIPHMNTDNLNCGVTQSPAAISVVVETPFSHAIFIVDTSWSVPLNIRSVYRWSTKALPRYLRDQAHCSRQTEQCLSTIAPLTEGWWSCYWKSNL